MRKGCQQGLWPPAEGISETMSNIGIPSEVWTSDTHQREHRMLMAVQDKALLYKKVPLKYLGEKNIRVSQGITFVISDRSRRDTSVLYL